MNSFRLNRKGQFSVIAAMLVAVVLVGAVVTTYSSIRYNIQSETPQTLSTVDEINLALKRILGFTVGYYGSVLQVTGNTTYAKNLASNYLSSGLDNIADIRPDLSPSFTIVDLDIRTNWYSNTSYSIGDFTIRYDLGGLGITGLTYSASSRLDVNVLSSSDVNKALLSVSSDGEPLVNLGQSNFKFYKYMFTNSSWHLTDSVTVPTTYMDGSYLLDLPQGMNSSYVVQVEDTRGMMVVASSFSKLTGTISWNTTEVDQGFSYVDSNTSNVDSQASVGSQSNFSAQQGPPDSVYDSLTEGASGTSLYNNYPTSWNTVNSTSYVSGTIADVQSEDSNYLQLRSYPIISNYRTISFDSSASTTKTAFSSSMSWSHTVGTNNDKILIVTVDTYSTSGQPAQVNSVTLGSTSLTQLVTEALTSGSNRIRSYVFYLLNPSSGTRTITVNFASSTSRAVGGSTSYYNVLQTAPTDITERTGSSSGTISTNSILTSDSYPKVLFGHIATYRSSSYSVTDNQNNRWSQASQTYKGFGSDKAVTIGSVTNSWTLSATASYVAFAVLLKPAANIIGYDCEAEFTGSSVAGSSWNNLVWKLVGSSTVSNVNVNYQLFNYQTNQYASSDSGFQSDILQTTERTKTQTITTGSTDFNDTAGNWKVKITASIATATQFDLKLNLIQYSCNFTNYALNLEAQWINVNASLPRQNLCIKTGPFGGSENLNVQIWTGNSWQYLYTLAPNSFNNISMASYISSSTLTIRFVGAQETSDFVQDSWNIDSMFLVPQPNIDFLAGLQDSKFTLEYLQNGTIRWIGENLVLTSNALPIPPVPVKAIHVNQTFLNGTNKEVPFQIEDWASDYQIPLGLTNNQTVFSNRQMIVFQADNQVVDFTIWWDGSDSAVQTPLAYTNKYFTVDAANYNLKNGKQELTLDKSGFVVTSKVGGVTSVGHLMRMEGREDTTNPELSIVISDGVVRNIVLGEAEYSNGITDCPNFYTNIVLTLPADVTYYTYQLRLMFIDSSRSRTISDMTPVSLTSSGFTPTKVQTQDGAIEQFTIVHDSSGTFSNYTVDGWTPHHWSQIVNNDATKGVGIMFTDSNNQKLYAFDQIAGAPTGCLNVSLAGRFIELSPVALASVSFTSALDIRWSGVVVTFDGTLPIYKETSQTISGLWILVEHPPVLMVTANS